MIEMTPETLRNFPTRVRWGQTVAVMTKAQVDASATAWEADRKRAEEANKTWVRMWQEEHDQCVETLARIEALEKLLLRWSVFAGQLVDEWWAISPNQEPTSYTPEGLELKELLAATAISLAALAAEKEKT